MRRVVDNSLLIDQKRSIGSYVYDKKTESYFLDFFSNYSSLPLGWNHPIFLREDFVEEMQNCYKEKIALKQYATETTEEFIEIFQKEAGWNYNHFHFSSTGSLAVEAAIKTAIQYKQSKNPKIIVLKNSFHGIYGYGSSLSDRFFPIDHLLCGIPIMSNVVRIENIPRNDKKESLISYENELLATIKKHGYENVAALLIEPVQCTAGDLYFPNEFFDINREITNKFDIPLIHDEIQTGGGVTGKMWYSEYHRDKPDIIVFGKKFQVSGIIANEKFDDVFAVPERLGCTFDGDLLDMIRCKYILKAYKNYHILENVRSKEKELFYLMEKLPIKNRNKGLLAAFDLGNQMETNSFFKQSLYHKFLCLKGGQNTIRLRPSLSLRSKALKRAINRISITLEEIRNANIY